MGRREVGLLLVAGFVAAGIAQPGSIAQESSRPAAETAATLQATGFRMFATRGVTDAVAPALRPAIVESQVIVESQSIVESRVIVENKAAAQPQGESQSQPQPRQQVSQAAKTPAAVPPPAATSPPAPASSAAVTVTPPLTPAGTTKPPLPTAGWPKTLPEAKAEAEARANPQAIAQSWPQAEIDLAKARCTAVLKGIDAVTIPEPAMRHGDCGTPAPVRLVSIGRNPEVALSPPPVLTCDMVVALHTWVKSNLQPLAKTHLGGPIIKIETMSDYSCRNAYGRTKSRLSEHGKANALDIRGFVTAKGDEAMLLADWGLTARDIAAQVALAKAEAEKKAREKAAADAAALAARSKDKGQPRGPGTSVGKAPSELASQPQPGAAGPALGLRDGQGTLSEGLPKVRLTIPGVAPDNDDDKPRGGSGFGIEPSRLGGPVPPKELLEQATAVTSVRAEKDTGKGGTAAPSSTKQPAATQQAPAAGKSRTPIMHAPASSRDQTSSKAKFLREAHAAGCKIFGTILGPEANNAHRNHFHVDLAERRSANFCE